MPAAARRRMITGATFTGATITGAMLMLAAAPADAPQAIGTWLLQCPPAGGCILLDRDPILPPASGLPAAALEVQRRGDRLVPVVTLRGLSAQRAVGGLLALQPHATLRFIPGPQADLACALDGDAVVCAPQGDAVATTADALPSAQQVEIGVVLRAPGLMPLPRQGRTLALRDTSAALLRLRAAGAAGESLPAIPGLDWIGFVHRLMQSADIGFPAR